MDSAVGSRVDMAGRKPSALVVERFRRIGLSAHEPLTSALLAAPVPHHVRDRRRVDVSGRPSLSVGSAAKGSQIGSPPRGPQRSTTLAVVDHMEVDGAVSPGGAQSGFEASPAGEPVIP